MQIVSKTLLGKRNWRHSSYFLLLLLLFACNSTQVTIPSSATTPLPPILQQAIAAHGGLERWRAMNTLQYTIERNDKPEQHYIDLKTRKVRLTHEDYTLGFDGKEVWISPNLAAFGKGSPRFYHNLFFYFYACPFVLMDPGINYEVLPPTTIEGQTYDVVKISFQAGVGDAPDDYYIAHFNTTTKLMDWLFYTVTYYSGEKNDKYKALKYDWHEINGLMLPSKLTGYKYENGKIGDFRYSQLFKNVSISKEAADPSVFKMPKDAAIDPLK